MTNLLDCRAQEALCRIHALTDEQYRDLWLSMAERWSCLAREENGAIGVTSRGRRHLAVGPNETRPTPSRGTLCAANGKSRVEGDKRSRVRLT